jgi:hypothetical protein
MTIEQTWPALTSQLIDERLILANLAQDFLAMVV